MVARLLRHSAASSREFPLQESLIIEASVIHSSDYCTFEKLARGSQVASLFLSRLPSSSFICVCVCLSPLCKFGIYCLDKGWGPNDLLPPNKSMICCLPQIVRSLRENEQVSIRLLFTQDLLMEGTYKSLPPPILNIHTDHPH